jgi:hypothetical protein
VAIDHQEDIQVSAPDEINHELIAYIQGDWDELGSLPSLKLYLTEFASFLRSVSFCSDYKALLPIELECR